VEKQAMIHNTSALLQPMVALMIWTMVMWLWMYATRIPAIGKTGIDNGTWVGSKGSDLDGLLPEKVQWIAHNYNHLHEAPTLFYAVALVLAITDQGSGLNAKIAWAYVALRVIHSLFQALVNKVVVRFGLFVLSSLCLMALILHAAIAVFWYSALLVLPVPALAFYKQLNSSSDTLFPGFGTLCLYDSFHILATVRRGKIIKGSVGSGQLH
jgi:hypothetical protein